MFLFGINVVSKFPWHVGVNLCFCNFEFCSQKSKTQQTPEEATQRCESVPFWVGKMDAVSINFWIQTSSSLYTIFLPLGNESKSQRRKKWCIRFDIITICCIILYLAPLSLYLYLMHHHHAIVLHLAIQLLVFLSSQQKAAAEKLAGAKPRRVKQLCFSGFWCLKAMVSWRPQKNFRSDHGNHRFQSASQIRGKKKHDYLQKVELKLTKCSTNCS